MALSYRIEFAPAARRQLKKLSKILQARIAKAIDHLQFDPYPDGVKKLSNANDLYRIRVGDYRVVYQVRDKELIILVIRVRHRKDVYS